MRKSGKPDFRCHPRLAVRDPRVSRRSPGDGGM